MGEKITAYRGEKVEEVEELRARVAELELIIANAHKEIWRVARTPQWRDLCVGGTTNHSPYEFIILLDDIVTVLNGMDPRQHEE